MVSNKSRWKLVRVLALGIAAFGVTASSQVSKVNACISCSQVCTQGACQSVCTESPTGGQNCTTNGGVCTPFGSCSGAGGGGGDGGGGFGGIGN
jgi:hypothetical protein